MSNTQTLTDSKVASLERPGGSFGAAWVHLTGELDIATAPELEQRLNDARLAAGLVVLDLRELAFMDCAGLRVIIEAAERARKDSPRLVVVRGPAHVDKLFTLSGTRDVVDMVDHDTSEPLRAGVGQL